MPGHARLIPGHNLPRFRGGLWLPISQYRKKSSRTALAPGQARHEIDGQGRNPGRCYQLRVANVTKGESAALPL